MVVCLFLRIHEKIGAHLYGQIRIEGDAIGASGHGVFTSLSDMKITTYRSSSSTAL